MKKILLYASLFLLITSKTFSQDGKLDSTFNSIGYVNTGGFYGSNVCNTVQSYNKIIVAGKNDQNQRIVLRYKNNGSLDSTFGTNGKVSLTSAIGYLDTYCVLTQNDGKIVVIGNEFDGSYNYKISVIRLDSNGTIDNAFGTNGRVLTSIGVSSDLAYSGSIQTDGKILVGAYSLTSNTDKYKFVVIRYNTDGTIDSTFNKIGYNAVDLGSSCYYCYNMMFHCGIALQNDGKIVYAGGFGTSEASRDMFAMRLKTDGTIDSTFNKIGFVTRDFYGSEDFANAVAIDANNKIVLAGKAGNIAAAARYNSDGSVDSTFGNNGATTFPIANSYYCAGQGISILPDGKILVGGMAYTSTYNIGIARLYANGNMDYNFGSSGVVSGDVLGSSETTGYGQSVQSDGKIILTTGYDFANFSVIRLKQRAFPTVNSWPTATPITYGDTLFTSNLIGGSASITGVYSFNSPKQVPQAGTQTESISFVPADSVNFTSMPGIVSVLVNKKELTVSNALGVDKVYDGKKDATINNASLSGIVGSDDVQLYGATSGTFAKADAGTAINISFLMYISGKDTANYYLTQPTSITANITPRELTIGGSFTADDKPYDGNTSAIILSNNLFLVDTIAGDTVKLTNVVAEFESAAVANNITVSITSAKISGVDSSNYKLSLTGAPTTTANITTTTGIKEQKQSNLSLYPNPANKFVVVNSNETIANVSIIDAIGQKVFESSSITNKTIDISNLTNGLYIIQIENSKGVIYTNKFIKN